MGQWTTNNGGSVTAPCLRPGADRPLTAGERALVADMFGTAIDPDPVRVHRRKWFPLQPATTVMAPCGHLHFHPKSGAYCDDFAGASLPLQALFIHEMVHVWQAQRNGKYWLVLMRHPFCRYRYSIKPGRPFHRYGIEQQAEIVRHFFLLRRGAEVAGNPPLTEYEALLPFGPVRS